MIRLMARNNCLHLTTLLLRNELLPGVTRTLPNTHSETCSKLLPPHLSNSPHGFVDLEVVVWRQPPNGTIECNILQYISWDAIPYDSLLPHTSLSILEKN